MCQHKKSSISLRKRHKRALLVELIEDSRSRGDLPVTLGEKDGGLNRHFRLHGVRWTWVENDSKQIGEMNKLLEEPVLYVLFRFGVPHFPLTGYTGSVVAGKSG